MANLAEYFSKHRYNAKYHIGDRVSGKWNNIPFVGSVGNDRLINPDEGATVTVHLDLPIKWQDKIYTVIIVKHSAIRLRR
jgi:hypothetical protein